MPYSKSLYLQETLYVSAFHFFMVMIVDIIKVLAEASPLLIDGAKVTISISLISIFCGIVIGMLSCILRLQRNVFGRSFSLFYTWIFRSTPMIVQAFFIYFGLPQLVQIYFENFTISVFWASVITLSLNEGAYLSEIFRSGINAVDIGQIEASRSLGLSSAITMRKIILPQAFRIVLPSLVNQFIIAIKDTSILSVIGLADVVNRARTYVGATYQFFATYMLVALFYCAIISFLMMLLSLIEKRCGNHDSH